MKTRLIAILTLVIHAIATFAQSDKFSEYKVAIPLCKDSLYGKLLLPCNATGPIPVALIIAGSGPTNMDGNTIAATRVITNNSLKMLAEELAINGIASLRYDKRGIGSSANVGVEEKDLRFDHYVADALAWIDFLKTHSEWSSITIVGHSEGSLIGMIAAHQHPAATQFISLAGTGRPAYEVIEEQLSEQPKEIRDQVAMFNTTLRLGITLNEVPSYLEALYRKSVQPYLISWFKYNPQNEISKLQTPTLIVQGDTDIQVSPSDATLLNLATRSSQISIIPEMNHILKHCSTLERQAQLLTYSNPSLPLHPALIPLLTDFIKQKNNK